MAIESTADGDARMDMRALWLALRRRLFRIVLVTVLLLAATYAVLLFVPKTYDATATILVESRASVYTRPAGDPTGASAISPEDLTALISSQVGLVKSRDTLLTVVRSEKLTTLPEFSGTAHSPFGFLGRFLKKPSAASAEDAAVDILARDLTVSRERDSSLIGVTVRSRDPQLAARLANAVARADVNRRAGLTLSDTADASQWLDQQITQLRQRVADAETKVANFKVANDLYVGTNSTSLIDQQMTEISSQITASQGRKNTAQSRASLIRGLLAGGQPIDGVEDVRNSVTIQQLEQQKAQLTAQRAQLLATLLPSHPNVRAVTAQIDSVNKQIGIEGRRVASALDAEAKIEDTLQASLQGDLNGLKAKEATATRQNVTLDALNREATADRDLLSNYLSRYGDAAARTDSNSDLPDVRVVTLAAPSNVPASPRTTLILAAVAFVSLAVQIAAVLFGELLSGRALIEPADFARREAQDDASNAAVPGEAVANGESRAEPAPGMVAAEPVPPAMADDRPRGNLRSWFTRHAKAAGTSLASFEPPMVAPAPQQAPAVPANEAPVVDAGEGEVDVATMARRRSGALADDDENAQRLADLTADMILGRARIVLFSAFDAHRESEVLVERLVGEVLHRGLSVAKVDAGSGRPSSEPGITDLASGEASFGDVVHKAAEAGLTEIPWGHQASLDIHSARPVTLIEALSDIYEVVLVMTGAVGTGSLPVFAGLPCRLVLVASRTPSADEIAAVRRKLDTLAFEAVEVIAAPFPAAEVA